MRAAPDVEPHQADALHYGDTWRGRHGAARFFRAMEAWEAWEAWEAFDMVEQDAHRQLRKERDAVQPQPPGPP